MIARSPAEAVEAYRHSLQRMISCVSTGVFLLQSASRMSPYHPSDHPHMLELSGARPLHVDETRSLHLTALQMYRIVQSGPNTSHWSVQSVAYMNSLVLNDTKEIVSFHWHPEAKQGKTFPHLHIGPAITGTGLQFGNRYVHRMHVPTGVVSLASIIRLTIEEFGARPLRNDWQQVLTQHEAV